MTPASRQGNFTRRIYRAALVVAVVAIGLPIASAQDQRAVVGPAAAVLGTCTPSKVRFSASPMSGGERSTTSRTFVNMPEATVGFTQGGTGPTCIIVEFSGLAYAAGTDKMAVRVLLNNTTTAQPGEMVIATNDNASNRQGLARGANFVFPLIEPGSHTLTMQYRSVTGGAVKIGAHTTIVHYAP
jgi:hypothetical protein